MGRLTGFHSMATWPQVGDAPNKSEGNFRAQNNPRQTIARWWHAQPTSSQPHVSEELPNPWRKSQVKSRSIQNYPNHPLSIVKTSEILPRPCQELHTGRNMRPYETQIISRSKMKLKEVTDLWKIPIVFSASDVDICSVRFLVEMVCVGCLNAWWQLVTCEFCAGATLCGDRKLVMKVEIS